MKKILIVDDDPQVCTTIAEILKRAGYQTDTALSGREAIEKCASEKFQLILLDLMMPEINGIDVLKEVRRLSPRTRVIIVTAFATIENAVEAIKAGASECILKPFKTDELIVMVNRTIEEASFEESMKKLFVDNTLSALNNPVRRKMIKLLNERQSMRLMELTRELGIDDHTKVIFHLRLLKEAELAEQREQKYYSLTKEGEKMVECLKILENYLISDAEASRISRT